MESTRPTVQRRLSRRTVTTALAWSVPAVAAATAAPALAATPPTEPANEYRFANSLYTCLTAAGGACDNDEFGLSGNQISGLSISNQIDLGDGSPLGFAVVAEPQAATGAPSEQTDATLAAPVQLVVAFPHGMVNTSSPAEMFQFFDGTEANWSAPELSEAILINPDKHRWTYDVFTFTWRGEATQPTVDSPQITGRQTESWAGTALTGCFRPNTGGYCIVDGNQRYYYAGYYLGGTAAGLGNGPGELGTFTTANGVSGTAEPLNGTNWVSYEWGPLP